MADGQSKTDGKQILENVGMQVETEVRRVLSFLNDEVVPEVRRDSSRVLRYAADGLLKVAGRLEERGATGRTRSDKSW